MCTKSVIAVPLGFHFRHLAIGYSARVDIHDAMSGNLLYRSTTGKTQRTIKYYNANYLILLPVVDTDNIISSLSCYLHQPGLSPKPHLAVGLTTGEVQVFELCTETMRPVYTVPRPEVKKTT